MNHMIRQGLPLNLALIVVVLVVACEGKGAAPPTVKPEGMSQALAAQLSPAVSTPTPHLAAATLAQRLPTSVVEPTSTPASTDIPEPTKTPTPELAKDELTDRWRIPLYTAVLTAGIYEVLLETSVQLQAQGRDVAGFLDVLGGAMLLKVAEDALAEWSPSENQTAFKPQLQRQIDTAQKLVSQWTQGEISSTDVPNLLEEDRQAAQDTLREIGQAMREDGLTSEDVETLMEELSAAMEQLTTQEEY